MFVREKGRWCKVYFRDFDRSKIVGYRGSNPLLLWYYITERLIVGIVEDPVNRIVYGGGVVPLEEWKTMASPQRAKIAARWIRKAIEPESRDNAEFAACDGELSEKCPALMEYMTLQVDGESKPRRTSSLLIFAEDGVFKGCLCDRQSDDTLWASADTIQELFGALDALLQQQKVPWRKKRGGTQSKSRQGGK